MSITNYRTEEPNFKGPATNNEKRTAQNQRQLQMTDKVYDHVAVKDIDLKHEQLVEWMATYYKDTA